MKPQDQPDEPQKNDIPITLNYSESPDSVIGLLLSRGETVEKVVEQLEKGETFILAPTLVDGKLVSVSIVSGGKPKK